MSDLIPAFSDITAEWGLYPLEYRLPRTRRWANLTVSVQGIAAPGLDGDRLHMLVDARWYGPGVFNTAAGAGAFMINGTCWDAYHVHIAAPSRIDNSGLTHHYDISLPLGTMGFYGTRILWLGVKSDVNATAWLAPVILRADEDFERDVPVEYVRP